MRMQLWCLEHVFLLVIIPHCVCKRALAPRNEKVTSSTPEDFHLDASVLQLASRLAKPSSDDANAIAEENATEENTSNDDANAIAEGNATEENTSSDDANAIAEESEYSKSWSAKKIQKWWKKKHHAIKHDHPHMVLFFFCIALGLGALTNWTLDRFAPWIPYTCILLIEGFFLGILRTTTSTQLRQLRDSMIMWETMDPHLMLYIFLPPLLFADCMNVQWHYFKRCFFQCVLLAGPGVLVGCLTTAAFVKFLLPYHWDWSTSLTLGSILSATDPVAVVSILKSCGVSPKLTTLISGESLLNDGAAVVIFNVFCAMMLGTEEALETVGASDTVTAHAALLYFLRMALLGPIVGVLFGAVSVWLIGKSASKTSHVHFVIQFAITIWCAYFSFFVGEQILHVSGVLACVSAGMVVGVYGQSRFVEPASMMHIWHMLEWVLNTLIFILSGVMIGHCVMRSFHLLGWEDLGFTVALYVGPVVLGRFLMVFSFLPLLNKLGYGLKWQSAVVACWGGLRGSVGIALAMAVNHELEDKGRIKDGARILLMACGAALLTLLVNGMTTGNVLSSLKMTHTTEAKEHLFKNIGRCVKDANRQALEELLNQVPESYRAATRTQIESTFQFSDATFLGDRTPTDEDVILVRELFLGVLKTMYQQQVELGQLPQKSRQVLILIEAVDVALDSSHEPGLGDFEVVMEYWQSNSFRTRIQDTIDKLIGNIVLDQEGACYVLTCFIQAHEKTQALISFHLGEGKCTEELKEIIVNESKAEVAKAQKALEEIDREVHEKVAVLQVSKMVLEKSRRYILSLHEGGLIDDGEAHRLLHQIDHDHKEIKKIDLS